MGSPAVVDPIQKKTGKQALSSSVELIDATHARAKSWQDRCTTWADCDLFAYRLSAGEGEFNTGIGRGFAIWRRVHMRIA